MARFDFRDAVDAMEDLLDRERSAILSGNFKSLEKLMAEKERLFSRVVNGAREQPTLDHLRRKAERNGRLLEAMRAGLKDASERLATMREGPAALHTYDAMGKRTPLSGNRR